MEARCLGKRRSKDCRKFLQRMSGSSWTRVDAILPTTTSIVTTITRLLTWLSAGRLAEHTKPRAHRWPQECVRFARGTGKPREVAPVCFRCTSGLYGDWAQ
jgi:hypothetical protein